MMPLPQVLICAPEGELGDEDAIVLALVRAGYPLHIVRTRDELMAELPATPERGRLLLVRPTAAAGVPDDRDGYMEFLRAYSRARERSRTWLFLITSRGDPFFMSAGDLVTAYLAAPASPKELLSFVTRAGAGRELPRVEIRDAEPIRFRGANSPSPDEPGECDCNCPAYWEGDRLHVLNSAGHPWRISGSGVAHLDEGYVRCEFDNVVQGGRWIESVHWFGKPKRLYGWYHLEPWGLMPERPELTAPRIGACRSDDGGVTWQDLGIVIEGRADELRLDTRNRYFAGGTGDFSVVYHEMGGTLYFHFGVYGRREEQGVCVARMRWKHLDDPVGHVERWCDGDWGEPGLGGRSTPIFPAATDWHAEGADAFWGPSVHYNAHAGWVMLLNRACNAEWKQEGVYASFSHGIWSPKHWSPPVRIMDPIRADGWYPQVVGLQDQEGTIDWRGTDQLAGQTARLFIRGESRWEITLRRAVATRRGMRETRGEPQP